MCARLAICFAVSAAACAESKPGTLTCKDGDRSFDIAVPGGRLGEARELAEEAKLTDCEFKAGRVARRDPPEIDAVDRSILPEPPPDDDDIDGVAGIDPPPPPPPPPAPPPPPQNIPPTLFEGLRISGNKTIEPDATTQIEIRRSGKDRVVGSFKLCISIDGDVTTISQLKSTGFADYDTKLETEMRTWKFRPYLINGARRSACTAYTFIYSMQP